MRRPLVVIAGGWGEGPRCFKLLVPLLTSFGYRVACLTSARWGGEHRDRSVPYPRAQHRLAMGVNRQLESLVNREKAIGVAHSMAGVYLPLAALLRPELFEAIVLVSPAGLMEKDSFWGLMNRLNKKTFLSIIAAMKDRRLRRATWWSLREGMLYLLMNPWRAIQEARCLPTCPTRSWISILRERGVKVYGILAADDAIFPRAQIEPVCGELDGYMVVDGQHDLWFYPEDLSRAIVSLVNQSTIAPGGTPR